MKELRRIIVKIDLRINFFSGAKTGTIEEISKVGVQNCHALIPFSWGLLPTRSKLVGTVLNTRNTVSIGHSLFQSFSDSWFPALLSTAMEIRSKRREDNNENERACELKLENSPPDEYACTVHYPLKVFLRLCFREISRSECRWDVSPTHYAGLRHALQQTGYNVITVLRKENIWTMQETNSVRVNHVLIHPY